MMFGVVPRASSPLARKIEAELAARAAAQTKAAQPSVKAELDKMRRIDLICAARLRHTSMRRSLVAETMLTIVNRRLREVQRRESMAASLSDLTLRTTIAGIQRATAEHYGVTLVDLIGQRRTKDIIRPRHVAMYLARTMTTCSLPLIGRRFDGRDHSSIWYAVGKIEGLLFLDQSLVSDIDAIKAMLAGVR